MAFELHRPTSLDAALDLAAALGPEGRYIAGGTDLVVQINRKRIAPQHLISLPKTPFLTGIAEDGGATRIGARATHKAVERFLSSYPGYAALCEAARLVGGHQVRNVGTAGGNIVNASPAADLVAALYAFDPILLLRDAGGAREIPLRDFIVGPGKTTRRPDEVLTEIRLAIPRPGEGSCFLKAGRRKAMEIAVVSIACRITLAADGETCAAVAIALGAVAPTVIRAAEAEAFLTGRILTSDVLREAGRLASEAGAPLDDVRSSARYRRLLLGVMTARAIAEAARRAGKGGLDVTH